MAWAKIDDQFHAHRKPRRAGLEAVGLWTLGLAYSSAYLTDGYVEPDYIAEVVPNKAKRERLVDSLEKHGMAIRQGEGFWIHDYLKFNPSAEHVLATRQKAADKKRAQRMSPGDTNGDRPRDKVGDR